MRSGNGAIPAAFPPCLDINISGFKLTLMQPQTDAFNLQPQE